MLARHVVTAGFTVAASLLIAGSAAAQTGVLSGTVFAGASGMGVAGATVTIAGTKLSAITGKDGRFTIANVPAGDQNLQIRRYEFAPLEDRVRVALGDTTHAYYELLASRTEASAAEREQLYTNLRAMTHGMDSLIVRMREPPEPVESKAKPLIIIDGVVMPPDFVIEAFDTNRIDTVEVLVRESATKLYGARASGGAIQVTTKPVVRTRPPRA